MPRKLMWMGPRGYERWVPAPKSSGGPFAPVGYAQKSLYLNGGAGVRTSRDAHMEYALQWNRLGREEFRPVFDMYYGLLGPGLIYWIDPMAREYNLAPYSWSWLASATYDSPPLYGNTRPSREQTSSVAFGAAVESAGYRIGPVGRSSKLYVPIPPGHTLWAGLWGEAGPSAMLATPVNGALVSGAAVALPTLSPSNQVRFSNSFTRGAGEATNSGVEFSFYRENEGVSILSGLMIQIHPTGKVPVDGRFISGMGHSGCEFESAPSSTPVSDPLDLTEYSAKLIETGAWR